MSFLSSWLAVALAVKTFYKAVIAEKCLVEHGELNLSKHSKKQKIKAIRLTFYYERLSDVIANSLFYTCSRVERP